MHIQRWAGTKERSGQGAQPAQDRVKLGARHERGDDLEEQALDPLPVGSRHRMLDGFRLPPFVFVPVAGTPVQRRDMLG